MNFSRKLLAASLAAIMVFTVGCGSSSSNPPPASGAPSGSASTDKEIILNFPCIWVAKDSKAQVFGEIVAQFNEENKGTIKVVIEEQTDYQAYRDKIRTNITAGTAPDIFTLDSPADLETFSRSGRLMDLTPYLDATWSADFQAGVLDGAKIDGKNFAIPYESALFPVLYNKRLLEKVGYTEFPKTYQELLDCCEKLKAAGITPMSQMTGENAYTSMLWYSQAVVAIGGPDVYERGLDDPAFVQAAEILQKMYDYTTSDAVGAGAGVSAGHFLNERTAIFMNGPWFFGRIATEGANGMADYVALAAPPVFEGGKGQENGLVGQTQALVALGAQSDPAKAEAAVKFLKYITKPELVSKLSEGSGALFTIKTPENPNIKGLQKELIDISNKAPYVALNFQSSVPLPVVNELPQAIGGLVVGEFDAEGFVEVLKAQLP